MPLPMFLPISESGQTVTLPGLAPDPSGSAPLFPPGTYPIMGSGEFTATLYPLADPLPPSPLPLPPEVASVALPSLGQVPTSGIQPVPAGMPLPTDMPQLPNYTPGELPLAPLGDQLPTSVLPFQQAWPPMPEPTPQVPLLPPEPPQQPQALPAIPPEMLPLLGPALSLPTALPLPEVGSAPPGVLPIPEVSLATPEMVPLPEVGLRLPEMPLTPAAPLTGATSTGWDALLRVLEGTKEHDERLRAFSEGRSVLRAPVPGANLGRVVWEQTFGEK